MKKRGQLSVSPSASHSPPSGEENQKISFLCKIKISQRKEIPHKVSNKQITLGNLFKTVFKKSLNLLFKLFSL
jgi:hypothetical protein